MNTERKNVPQPLTPERVLDLKREATEMKKRDGVKQTAALAIIAQREGFTSWERLLCEVGGRDAVLEVKRDVVPTESRVRRNDRRAAYLRKEQP
jgi:hypothetical protein